MKTPKNTAKLWNKLWSKPLEQKDYLHQIEKAEKGILWQRMQKNIMDYFGSFESLSTIEIGAGSGTYSALMKKSGAQVTLLDYSSEAIKKSQLLFNACGLSAEFITHNALALPVKLLGQFDIAMSFGLTEHFKGEERLLINRAHFDLLKDNGMAMISVPNKYNLPYRMLKLACDLKGIWYFGEEYPYSRKELINICKKMGIKNYFFIGDSFPASFRLINPLKVSKHLNKIFAKKTRTGWQEKKEKGTWLDQYFGHSIMLCAKRSSKLPNN